MTTMRTESPTRIAVLVCSLFETAQQLRALDVDVTVQINPPAPTAADLKRAHKVLSGGARELAQAFRRVTERKAAGPADGTPWNEPKKRGRMTQAGKDRIRKRMRARWRAAKKAGKNHL